MLEIRRANERGRSVAPWLDSRHTFSFADYHDPAQCGFSDLLVINDDRVRAGQGFDTHSHRDMEIFSCVLSGSLEHKDSMGNGSVIHAGDVQMMSAGTGIRHSEFNPSADEDVHFLQIWIVPSLKGATPRYAQISVPDAEKRGRLRLIVSPETAPGVLHVHQDMRLHIGLFTGAETATLDLGPGRYAYVFVPLGQVAVNGETFNEGDGARVRNEERLVISGGRDAEVLVFDLRPNERPER